MKGMTFAGLALVVVMVLAGCSTQAASMAKMATSTISDTEGSLPVVTQLLVGIFALQDTGQAVTAEQAQELLPLWKAYRSMSGSASSSAVELQALVKQLQSTMTEEQSKAISAMELDAEDLSSLMQEQNIDATAGVRENSGSSNIGKSQSTTASGAAPMGGVEGGPPPDGGGMPGGEMPAGSASSSDQASGTAPSGGGNAVIPTALLDALINMLAAQV